MFSTHSDQLKWIQEQKRKCSMAEMNMLTSIEASIYDSKSHIVHSCNTVHITISQERYHKYVKHVIMAERS